MVFQLQQVTFIIFFVKFSYSSPKTSSRTHQSCPQRGISQVPGLAVMERSGDLSLPQVYFVFSGFWGTVSCDVKAGPQPPLHHGRHLNPFPLLAFYTTFTAAQVFNTDQSLLLSPSFITTSFLLFCSFLLIRFSFTVSAFTPCVPTMLLPLSSSRPVYLSLPPFFFLSPLLAVPPLSHSIFLPPPSLVFIICWRAECGRMLVIWRSDCIGHAWMIPNLVPNILSLWVMTLIITNGGWWIPGTSWVFHELHFDGMTGALRRKLDFFVFPMWWL